ncbi:hypothetical protein FRC01_009542, partial [Tulasnella sp. 417]
MSSRDFLHLINAHRSRWVAATFRLPAQQLSEFTDAPTPRLDALRIASTNNPASSNNTTIHCTPTLIKTLANLQHLYLHRLQFHWEEIAGTFSILRTLVLSNLRRGITFDLIVQVIGKNPFLEHIALINIEPDPQTPPPRSSHRLLPPRLRIFRVVGSLNSLENILSQIQFPPTLEVLVIAGRASWSHEDGPLWIKMISPLSLTIQRLHEACGGSTIYLKYMATCTWKTGTDTRGFEVGIRNMNPAVSLQCFAPVANTLHCTNGLPHLGFVTESTYLEDDDLLAVLVSIQTVTHIQITTEGRNFQIARFMEVL